MTGRKPPSIDLTPLGEDRKSPRDDGAWQDHWRTGERFSGETFSRDRARDTDLDRRALYEGVLTRRSFAFIIDIVIAMVLSSVLMLATCTAAVTASILTFGIISIPVLLLPAMIVHGLFATFTIGGDNAATWGMRALGLRVIRNDGGRVDHVQAFLMVAMYFASTAILFPVLIVGLFTGRNRLLHDLVAGTLVVRWPLG